MPWKEASPMGQRTQFIADHLRDVWSITELCALYGISRKTGYKWIDRYLRHGPAGLEERSRRPRRSPNQTAEEIVTAILDARRRHPTWGGKKLLALLHKRHPRWTLPGRSTACDILRRRVGHPGRPTSQIPAPNDLWSADFKGHFRTGDGRYCYPLTVADGFSRYLLGCEALASTAGEEAKPASHACSKSMGCRSAFAPTTACRSPPRPWPACRSCRPGGCAWASCRSSSSPVGRRRTAGMSGCTAP